MDVIFAAIIVIGVLSFLIIFVGSPRRSSTANNYNKLLSRALGDRERVNRLIEYERKRNPNATTEELIKKAIKRWDSGNR